MAEQFRQAHVGGSFAPPLSDELLEEYHRLAVADKAPVGDCMLHLLKCCQVWWDLPEPEGTVARDHPSGRGVIIDLAEDHAEALDPHIPWKHEIEALKILFDGIDPAGKKDLRNAAFHLLWHVIELDLGREPLTKDKL